MDPIHALKQHLNIEALIGETFTITGRGRTLTTQEHDSLKIWTDTQSWFWFSKGIGGDLFDWYQHIHRCDFHTALEDLARKANIELHPMSPDDRAAWAAQRADQQQRTQILTIAAHHYQSLLWSPAGAPARDYCTTHRGWTPDTLRREQLGYNPLPSTPPNPLYTGGEGGTGGMGGALAESVEAEARPLHTQLRDADLLDHPLSRAVLSIPHGHLVYIHRLRGQVIYLSARSIEHKRHYNLPIETAGPKQPYHNHPAAPDPDAPLPHTHLLVEGQADAIALGQLGLEATALCGLDLPRAPGPQSPVSNLQSPVSSLQSLVSSLPVTHIAFDNDPAGHAKALETALALNDPLCRLVTWPATAATDKDAADFVRAAATPADAAALLTQSPTALACLATQTANAKDQARTDLLRRFFTLYTGLDTLVATDLKPALADRLCAGKIAHFNRLLKAHQKEAKAHARERAERREYSAGGTAGGLLWEQCIAWDAAGAGACVFAVRQPTSAITYQKSVTVGPITHLPYPATLGVIRNRRIVLFPERAEEYGSEQQLIKAVQSFLHAYFDFGDPFYEKLAAYYILFTWLYDCFENLPYLRALGDYGTGKTRFIQTIGVLCYRPMLVSGASTASPVFRLIDMFRGTLIMDEADFANSDADNEIIKIINVGYYKGGCVMRAEKEPDAEVYAPETYDVFGPKLLATRKPFTDRAVESRCLTKRTTSARPRPDIPFLLNDHFWSRAQTLRNQLLMYRLRHHRAIIVDEALANASVEPRLNQVTMALKSIIADPALRHEIDTFIAAYNDSLIRDRQMTLPAIITQALAEIYYAIPTPPVDGGAIQPTHPSVNGEAGGVNQPADSPDLTMQGIAAKVRTLLADIDPDLKVHPRLVSKILHEDLGLIRTAKHPLNRRVMVTFTEPELLALMQRYGIALPNVA